MCDEVVQGTEKGTIKNLAEFADALGKLPLRFHPGKRYGYSYGLDILGRVIEVVSGMTLGKFLEKEIFGPLKLKDTGFSLPKSKLNRLAAVYCGRESAINVG